MPGKTPVPESLFFNKVVGLPMLVSIKLQASDIQENSSIYLIDFPYSYYTNQLPNGFYVHYFTSTNIFISFFNGYL